MDPRGPRKRARDVQVIDKATDQIYRHAIRSHPRTPVVSRCRYPQTIVPVVISERAYDTVRICD